MNNVQNEKIDMAGQGPGKTTGQPPIVLARLPRVGARHGAPQGAMAHQTVPSPEVMPHLDLRTEIQQRSRLQVAEKPADSQSAAASHFVDRQHFVSPGDRQQFTERERTERLDTQPQHHAHGRAATQDAAQVQQHRYSSVSASSAGKSLSVVARLFQIHARLAPYAGLIVTLALIASAGLLYWMIVGPTRAPAPNYETPSFEMQPEGFGANFDDRLEHADDSKPVAELATLPKAWSHVPLSVPPQEEPASDRLAPPKHESATSPQSPSARELRFPETRHPQKLDFTAAVPRRLPVVAVSPTSTSR